MEYFGGIGPVYNVARAASTAGPATRDEAAAQFAMLFYSELFKQTFGAQSGAFEEKSGLFGSYAPYPDLFMEQFMGEIMRGGDIAGKGIAGR